MDSSSPNDTGGNPGRDVDLLITAGTVITMEPGATPLSDGAVAIDDDRIVDVGPSAELMARYRPRRTIGGADKIALPGFVNAHQHLTGDRLIRSMIPDDLEPGRSIFEWAVPVHAAHTPEDDELSAVLSLLEAVGNGITFTIEAGTVANPDRLLAAYERVGVGGTLGSWGSDTDGIPWSGSIDEVLDRQRQVIELARNHPTVDGWITLVGHDLMSDELVAAASEMAKQAATGLTFHLSPTDSDPVSYLARTGRRPAVHLAEIGALGPHVLLGHGVHLDDAELDRLLDTDTSIAYCPWAYLRLGQGVSRAGRHIEFIRRGGRVALGCDAENAGDAIDLLGVAALAAGLAKDTAIDPTVFGAHEALHLATLGGAEAIGMGHEIGSLAPGKRADITLIGTSGYEWVPRSPDPVLQLVWASDGRSVSHVVAAGHVVVEHGRSTLVDIDDLRDEAAERHARVVRDAGLG